jgi:hypothetical protein
VPVSDTQNKFDGILQRDLCAWALDRLRATEKLRHRQADMVYLSKVYPRAPNMETLLLELRLYESLRLPRTSRVQAASKENKTRFHLPDGLEQRARRTDGRASSDWFLKAIAWVYGHDAEAIEAV